MLYLGEKGIGRIMSKEAKVGLCTMAICILLGIGAFFWNPFHALRNNTYQVQAIFTNVQGVKVGNKVMHAGVAAGKVQRISIEDGKAVVHLAMKKEIAIPKDAQFTIDNQGVIGDYFIKISGGNVASGTLQDGMTVEEYHSDKMDRLLEKANHLMDTAESVGESINKIRNEK